MIKKYINKKKYILIIKKFKFKKILIKSDKKIFIKIYI